MLLHFSFLSLSYPVIWSIYPSEKTGYLPSQRKWHAEKVAFPPPAIWRRESENNECKYGSAVEETSRCEMAVVVPAYTAYKNKSNSPRLVHDAHVNCD